jgi:cell shape-determining protein MreC
MDPRNLTRILVVLLALATLGAIYSVRPLALGAKGAMGGVLRFGPMLAELLPWRNGFAGGQALRERVVQLEEENAQLRLEIAQCRPVAEENAELRQLLELGPGPEWRCIAAPVIAWDPLSWGRRFRIGKGTDDGIRVGAVVLAGRAVVGRIADAGGSTAMVVTIADPACRLSVRFRDSGAVGILAGRAPDWQTARPLCLVDYIEHDGTPAVAEPVETSGLSQQTPAGLRVGRLTPWGADEVLHVVAGNYARAKVRPAGDLRGVRHVTVAVPNQP